MALKGNDVCCQRAENKQWLGRERSKLPTGKIMASTIDVLLETGDATRRGILMATGDSDVCNWRKMKKWTNLRQGKMTTAGWSLHWRLVNLAGVSSLWREMQYTIVVHHYLVATHVVYFRVIDFLVTMTTCWQQVHSSRSPLGVNILELKSWFGLFYFKWNKHQGNLKEYNIGPKSIILDRQPDKD